MQAENLKNPEQHIGTVQILDQPTKPDLLPYRALSVATMGNSTTLANSVFGGVLPRAIPLTPGRGPCSTKTAVYSVERTIRSGGAP